MRTPDAGAAPASSTPDYFDSLAELAAWARLPRPPLDDAAAPPRPPPLVKLLADAADPQRGRVLVCHDFKGGYVERDDERSYTFEHFQLIDTFVYFSHHRVTCPPAGWIRAAHVAGTAILGTLIFEWDAGKIDILELVTPGAKHFKLGGAVSTKYADLLIDLTRERGFDGWLVNVEVALGAATDNANAREHAAAVLTWLAYFSASLKAAVPHAQVLWYDAITTDGRLAWQNGVTEANLPFLRACDGIFCNYWWRPEQLADTANLVTSQAPGRQRDVYFGIDVFGRGTYGGGGFESWRAMHAIQQAPAADTFSTALFAPGWTVEAESLQHSLTSSVAHARWRKDDDYLWRGGQATPSVGIESERLERERLLQRGVMRARHLAAATARDQSEIPLAFRSPSPALFDYYAPLPPLPSSSVPLAQRHLAHFSGNSRPTPCPAFTFCTNFSSGAGHAFFIRGENVYSPENTASSTDGWTDIGLTAIQALPLHADAPVVAAYSEDEAWEGERSLRIYRRSGTPDARVELQLFNLAFPPVLSDLDLELRVVWKSAQAQSAHAALRPSFSLDGRNGATEALQATEPRDVGHGWSLSTVETQWRASRDPFEAVVSMTLPPHVDSVIIGAVAIRPSGTLACIADHVKYSAEEDLLEWDYALRYQPAIAHNWPRSNVLAHVSITGKDGSEVYLGTTFARCFQVGSTLPKDSLFRIEVGWPKI